MKTHAHMFMRHCDLLFKANFHFQVTLIESCWMIRSNLLNLNKVSYGASLCASNRSFMIFFFSMIRQIQWLYLHVGFTVSIWIPNFFLFLVSNLWNFHRSWLFFHLYEHCVISAQLGNVGSRIGCLYSTT